MTPTPVRLLSAVLALILLAAACGGSSSDGDTHDDTEPAGTHDDTEPAGTRDEASQGDHDTSQEVSEDATVAVRDHDTDASSDHDHSNGEGGSHAASDTATRYDADVADAAQTIIVEVVDGDPVGGVARVQVALGSVVALMVTSDVAEDVHVHGYDILRSVSDGHPAHFALTAAIPGVFEVEFESSGRLLMQLEIS